MSIKIVLGALLAVVVVGGGVLLLTTDKSASQGDLACKDVCQAASQTCPSLVNERTCNSACSKVSEESKKHLKESKSCEQITSRPDLIADMLIPEAIAPKTVDKNASGCEAACGSYVGKCLTLVPNATEALFADGLNSCMKECSSWSANKINCMIDAFDCESFTNACGL